VKVGIICGEGISGGNCSEEEKQKKKRME